MKDNSNRRPNSIYLKWQLYLQTIMLP